MAGIASHKSSSVGVLAIAATLAENFQREFAQSITSNLGDLRAVLKRHRVGEVPHPLPFQL